jgi:hypothetical protein
MAVAERKSGQISNRDAVPRIMTTAAAVAAMIRGFVATVETVSGDSVNSVYRFTRVPSNAVMHTLRVYTDDIGTTGVGDIGLYDTTDNGGGVVDADFFSSAVNMNAGALNGADIIHESAVLDLDKIEKPIWQVLGLANDPKKEYDICVTLTGAADAAGTIALKGTYAI